MFLGGMTMLKSKRILAIILITLFLIAQLPVMALADEALPPEGETAEVNSWAGLKNAVEDNSIQTIYITNNIDAGENTEDLTINRKILICGTALDGTYHSLDLGAASIVVSSGGELTVEGAVQIISRGKQVILLDGGKLTIEDAVSALKTTALFPAAGRPG